MCTNVHFTICMRNKEKAKKNQLVAINLTQTDVML